MPHFLLLVYDSTFTVYLRPFFLQIMMYNMDHIKQAGYYFEVFIENAPNGLISSE